MKYRLLTSFDSDTLSKKVDAFLKNDDWALYGNPFAFGGGAHIFGQAVISYKEEENDTE